MRITSTTTIALTLGLFGLLGACLDQPPAPTPVETISSATCGGCYLDEPPTIGEDGTIHSCAPCEVTTGGFEQPVDPGVLSFDEPPGNKTTLECDDEYGASVGKCRKARDAGNAKCLAAYNASVQACYAGIYAKCGTTSPYHECVIRERSRCQQEPIPALESCQEEVETAYRKCVWVAKVVWQTCINNAGKVLPHLPGFFKSLLPG